MGSHDDEWLNPAMIKRIRLRITVILWIIILLMIYLNHSWLAVFFTRVFHSLT